MLLRTTGLLTGCFWLIDPLDGTKEFLARNDEFTVNIALILDGVPVWGFVCAPALDQQFWGGRAYGSRRLIGESAEPIRVTPQVLSDSSYRVVASKSHLNQETAAFIEKLGSTVLVQAVVEGAAGYVYDTAGPRLLYGKPDVLNLSFIAASVDFKELRGGA